MTNELKKAELAAHRYDGLGAPMTERETREIYPQTWVTNETPPRLLNVKGVSLVDPDCLVAEVIGQPKHDALWIVQPSGYVCGLQGNVYAARCAEVSAHG